MLTPAQQSTLDYHLRETNLLTNEELILELTDHYTTALLDRMAQGMTFEAALTDTQQAFSGRKGLQKRSVSTTGSPSGTITSAGDRPCYHSLRNRYCGGRQCLFTRYYYFAPYLFLRKTQSQIPNGLALLRVCYMGFLGAYELEY